MATPSGGEVGSRNQAYGLETLYVETPKWQWLMIDNQYGSLAIYCNIETWRENAYYDDKLHVSLDIDKNKTTYQSTNKFTHSYEIEFGIGDKDGRIFVESGQGNAPFPPSFYQETAWNASYHSGIWHVEAIISNKDKRDEWIEKEEKQGELIPDALISSYDTGTPFGFYIYGYIYIYDESTDWSGTVHRMAKTETPYLQYPPYRELGDSNKIPNPPNIGSPTGGKDIINDYTETVTITRDYKISKVGNTQKVSWSPDKIVGDYKEPVTNKVVIQRVNTFYQQSPISFITPEPVGSSYTAYVERYYTNSPDVLTRSNTVTMYTYSQPMLSSISLNKNVISPRSGASLTVTLNEINKRVHNFENKFRTCIWSPYKNPYLDYENDVDKVEHKSLNDSDIRTMFPDSRASNGEINSKIQAKRKNLGILEGNPGNGSLVYETGVKNANLKIQYKPTVPIEPNEEPDPNRPEKSGIAYYKKENNREGAKLTAGHTWVLPYTYNLPNMNGVNVRLQYPKTDASGVLSGYRIRLYSPNDGSPDSNIKYYEDHWNTTNYIDTYFISYSILRRGISGNEIEITPYYMASNGEKWYGPVMRKKFVDIAWMLDKPVIDCPLTGTTWHNHKYRILFKLPNDNDTHYNHPEHGVMNDIENHYGRGTYRYQEIQMNINGTITTFADNVFYNAHNSWISPINISNAKLTYLRNIIVNPSLIDTYSDNSQYTISIRIRKAYGQNPNWDGWSDWSDTINVKRKTVKNAVVNRHEYIMASHYMNVQTAFNLSTACYAKKASDNSNFVVKESFDRVRGDNINGPHLSPPENQPFQTIREYISEFNDLHQLKNKINSYATFDTDKNRNPVKLDYQNNLLATFVPSQEFITAAKDQNGVTENNDSLPILKGRNYMKYMCDELNHLY